MNALTRCCEYLESNHIQYARWIHPPAYSAREVASSAEIPAHSVAKTVIYCGDNGYGMLLVPADSTIDFTEIRRLLGLSEIRLATEAELAKLFPDSELGAMPPLGNLAQMPVLVDTALTESECIFFNGGTHRDVISLIFEDFERLVNPLVARFAVPEADPDRI